MEVGGQRGYAPLPTSLSSPLFLLSLVAKRLRYSNRTVTYSNRTVNKWTIYFRGHFNLANYSHAHFQYG